jgi:hypothetical protein
MRAGLLLAGVVLVSVGAMGFLDGAARWISWLDLLAGLAALAVVLMPDPRTKRGTLELRATPWALAVLLLAASLIGLARAERWQAVWTFVGALALAAIGAVLEKQERDPAAARSRSKSTWKTT